MIRRIVATPTAWGDPAVLEGLLAPAVAALRRGEVVALPTETVYGLGAVATDAAAVAKIFAAKARPADNPLIVHVAALEDVAQVAAEIPPLATTLARVFWPGPLTLVLPAHPDLPSVTTGGLSTVAVRCPAHPVAQALLHGVGGPLAAPSANTSGRPSPTTADHVIDDLAGRIGIVVDGGPCAVGIESTVVDVTQGRIRILRPGAVTAESLAGFGPVSMCRDQTARRSPGTRYAHYQPDCRVHVVGRGGGMAFAQALSRAGREQVGVVAAEPVTGDPTDVAVLAVVASAAELGRRLYALLRQADDEGLDHLVVEAPEAVGVGAAVVERLARAAGGV